MKKFLLTTVLIIIGSWAFAQERIAVFPFEDLDKVFIQNESVVFYRWFSNEFVNSNADRFSVIPRQEVEKLINTEATFQLSDFSAQKKTAEMNRVLNGTRILSGLIAKQGKNIHIVVSLYTYPELVQLPGGATLSVANTEELFKKIPELVQKMQTGMTGGKGGANNPVNLLNNEYFMESLRLTRLARQRYEAKDYAASAQFYAEALRYANLSEEYVRSQDNAAATSKTYKVGDTGPAGGIVFYDRGFIADGWRYLEAAPVGTDFNAEWGAYGQNIAGTDTSVGSGKRNTQIINERLKALGEKYRAAQICASMDINGYKDWFLPSQDELDLMYKNLKQKGLGGFNNSYYRSSSQTDNYNAWLQYFSDGSKYAGAIDIYTKGASNSVRAVRAF